MTDMAALSDTELLVPDGVEEWRKEELVRAGYPEEVAGPLARQHDVDLHRACDLLRRGATVDQAIRILT